MMRDGRRPRRHQRARGVQGNEATAALARDLNMDWTLWRAGRGAVERRDDAGGAATVGRRARRSWWRWRDARGAGAGDAEQYAFRRMMATHYAIQAEVLAARRETGRALQSWSIPAGSGAEQARAIQQMMEQSGGAAQSRPWPIGSGPDPERADPAAVAGFVRQSWAPRPCGRQEAWINALLSPPKTHMVNIMSNTFVAAQQVMERRVAESFGDAVAGGEAATMAYGMITSLKDARRLAGKTWRDGGNELGAMLGKADLPRASGRSSQAFGLDAGGGIGRAGGLHRPQHRWRAGTGAGRGMLSSSRSAIAANCMPARCAWRATRRCRRVRTPRHARSSRTWRSGRPG